MSLFGTFLLNEVLPIFLLYFLNGILLLTLCIFLSNTLLNLSTFIFLTCSDIRDWSRSPILMPVVVVLVPCNTQGKERG